MNVNIEGKLRFDDSCSRFPQDIVKEYSSVIKEQTRGFVQLNVDMYNEELDGDGLPSLTSSLRAVFALTHTVDVQDKLGDVNRERTRYEVCFGSGILDKYKYRIMFLEYGIGGFPVKLYIAREIVQSINRDMEINIVQVIPDEDSLKHLMDTILSCSLSVQLMQEIINASKRKLEKETKEASSDQKDDSLLDNNKT